MCIYVYNVLCLYMTVYVYMHLLCSFVYMWCTVHVYVHIIAGHTHTYIYYNINTITYMYLYIYIHPMAFAGVLGAYRQMGGLDLVLSPSRFLFGDSEHPRLLCLRQCSHMLDK